MTLIFHQNEIERRIFTLRTVQVLLDKDLAEMYDVETKVLNQAVKRNIDRFPLSFRFQLTELEFAEYQKSQIMSLNLKSQIVTSSEHGGRRYLPYAFTEQGVAMLSAVLRSETAVKISVQIINAFVEMRKLIAGNIEMLQRFNKIELKQTESDQKFENNLAILSM
ncbi:MAG: ORF6N domain-containing protein [Sphingobacteriales bacterium]|nr:MAG: ORF6N domain-containing protein [Sphingobacteriales bacterium]